MDDERCYVVRDEEGDYWTEATPTRNAWQSTQPKERLTRVEADAIVDELAAPHVSASGFGPLEAQRVKVIPRAKPKAPREVFLMVDPDGEPTIGDGYCLSRSRTDVEEGLSGGQRVVRYVLAEGE